MLGRVAHSEDLICLQTLASSFLYSWLSFGIYWIFLLPTQDHYFVEKEFLLCWQNAVDNTLDKHWQFTLLCLPLQAQDGCLATGKFSFCCRPVQTTVWKGARGQRPLLPNLSLHFSVTCSSRRQRWHSKWNWTGNYPHPRPCFDCKWGYSYQNPQELEKEMETWWLEWIRMEGCVISRILLIYI